jgi:hypothetical protein
MTKIRVFPQAAKQEEANAKAQKGDNSNEVGKGTF